MKIGFFGTPGIASYYLDYLCEKYEVAFAVTSEDRPAGRHQHLACCAAKLSASCRDISVLQPRTLKDPAFVDEIRKFGADIFIVVAYGKIIPADVYALPPLKTINLHPSLLPKYRGAAPMQWSLINGERETGVTVQLINERLDAGDIICQEVLPLDENINAALLHELVLPVGARLLDRAIGLLSSGAAVPISQKEDEATYCGKIDRETAHIDWSRTSSEIHNLVRGLNPKPVAWTTFRGKNIRIFRTLYCNDAIDADCVPGALVRFQKKRLLAGTGDGWLEILNLQPETKKEMDGLAFINGHRLADGDRFE